MTKPIYRMSEAGKCHRALSAMRLGYKAEPKPEWLERTAEEGKRHEAWLKEELDSKSIQVICEQEEVIIDHNSYTLIGHIDGVAVENGIRRLLEIKTMSQFEFDRWMRGRFNEFPAYAAQITCYMEATGLKECLYIVKNRNNGYEDKQALTKPPMKIGEITHKLADVEDCVTDKQLASATFDPQSYECKRCDYRDLCIPKIKALDIDESVLNLAVTGWREGKKLVDKGQDMVDEARAVFEPYIEGLPEKKLIYSGLSIMKYKVHRESYNKKMLEQLVPAHLLEKAVDTKDYEAMKVDDLESEK